MPARNRVETLDRPGDQVSSQAFARPVARIRQDFPGTSGLLDRRDPNLSACCLSHPRAAIDRTFKGLPSACRFDRDGPTHAATRVEYRAASRDKSARPPARTRVAGQSQRNDPARAGSEPKLDIRAGSPGSLSRRSRWLWQFHIASIRVPNRRGSLDFVPADRADGPRFRRNHSYYA